jgi:hypothetical protein
MYKFKEILLLVMLIREFNTLSIIDVLFQLLGLSACVPDEVNNRKLSWSKILILFYYYEIICMSQILKVEISQQIILDFDFVFAFLSIAIQF